MSEVDMIESQEEQEIRIVRAQLTWRDASDGWAELETRMNAAIGEGFSVGTRKLDFLMEPQGEGYNPKITAVAIMSKRRKREN